MTPMRLYLGSVLADSTDSVLHTASNDVVMRSINLCNSHFQGAFQVRLKVVDPSNPTVKWFWAGNFEVLPTDVVVENVVVPIPSGYTLVCNAFNPDPTLSIDACVGGTTT